LAKRELEEAAVWYEEQLPGLGEAEQAKRQFSQAWAHAGVTLTSSRF
jgi:hypothetical protein